MPVRVDINKNWSGDIQKSLKDAVLEMATDIDRRAKIIAPVDTRALVNSSVIEPVTDGYRVKFGSSKVPYARRRHFENKKHPQTLRYLEKAGDSVARGDTGKYFRGKV